MLYNPSPWRKSGSKNSLKAQNYHDSPTLDDGYGVCKPRTTNVSMFVETVCSSNSIIQLNHQMLSSSS